MSSVSMRIYKRASFHSQWPIKAVLQFRNVQQGHILLSVNNTPPQRVNSNKNLEIVSSISCDRKICKSEVKTTQNARGGFWLKVS